MPCVISLLSGYLACSVLLKQLKIFSEKANIIQPPSCVFSPSYIISINEIGAMFAKKKQTKKGKQL